MMAKKAPNPTDRHVGSRVRMRRMMLSMSQEKLGDALGLTFQQVQKYEKGANRIGASRLQQIAHILQVPVAFFFEGAPHARRQPADGMGEAPSPAYVSDFLATSDGLALTKAFMRIKDPKLRRRIVDLVEQMVVDDEATELAALRLRIRPLRSAHAAHILTARPDTAKTPPIIADAAAARPFEECSTVSAPTFCSPASPFPKAIPTRSATRSPMPSSTRSSRTTSSSASPTTAWSTRGWAARRCAPPTRSSSPAKAAARRRCSHKHGDKAVVDRELITEIARGVVKDIGYDQDGFSYHGADVEVLLHGQSPDIAMGVDAKKKKGGEEEGAGDQGMMFGFACTESEVYEKGSFMPAPIYFAHKILKVLSDKRRSGQLFDLQPDAKSQVTVQYVNGKPVGCTKVVVSTQHNAETRNGKKYTPSMVKDLIGDAVASALPKGWMPKKASDFLVNPTGNFVVGGPDGDCGLTGRKIIVDTYGGYAPHGGGAFSGKDPTKVDRSAAYAARYLAKNVVAAGLAERCTIQIAYAIGVADPMSVLVDTHGTGKVDERKLEKVLPEMFRLTPTNIRRTLKLNRPIYRRTAAYGHFGRAPDKDGGFSWEKTDLAGQLKSAFK